MLTLEVYGAIGLNMQLDFSVLFGKDLIVGEQSNIDLIVYRGIENILLRLPVFHRSCVNIRSIPYSAGLTFLRPRACRKPSLD